MASSVLAVLKSPRAWLLTALGFSSGLPLFLVSSTLAAWMKNEGVNLQTIGVFALVTTPYSLKFLWAPFMDRFTLPFLGRRRGWLLVTQGGLMAVIAAMGLVNPRESPLVMASLALGMSFLSASQDIVADAWRTDILPEEERGFGTATFIMGYRIGLIAAGALALTLSDVIGWQRSYWTMAALMCVGLVATLLAPEPPEQSAPRNLAEALVLPFIDYFKRHGALLALAFLVLYKLGDAIARSMTTPFFIELGFSNTEVGTVNQGFGMVATIIGGLLGGGLMASLGLRRSLFVFGALQALTNVLFLVLSLVGRELWLLSAAIGVDNFCGGLADTAFSAFMMSLCNKRFSATQFALISSLGMAGGRVLSSASGYLAHWLAWPGFFGLTIALAAPALVLLAFLPQGLAAPAPEVSSTGGEGASLPQGPG